MMFNVFQICWMMFSVLPVFPRRSQGYGLFPPPEPGKLFEYHGCSFFLEGSMTHNVGLFENSMPPSLLESPFGWAPISTPIDTILQYHLSTTKGACEWFPAVYWIRGYLCCGDHYLHIQYISIFSGYDQLVLSLFCQLLIPQLRPRPPGSSPGLVLQETSSIVMIKDDQSFSGLVKVNIYGKRRLVFHGFPPFHVGRSWSFESNEHHDWWLMVYQQKWMFISPENWLICN